MSRYRNPLWSPEYTGRKPSFNDMGAFRLNKDHPLNQGLQFETLCNDPSCIARDLVHRFDLNQYGDTGTLTFGIGSDGAEFQAEDKFVYRDGFPTSRMNGSIFSLAARLFMPTGTNEGYLGGIGPSGDVPYILLNANWGAIQATLSDDSWSSHSCSKSHPFDKYFTFVVVSDGASITGYVDGLAGTPTAVSGSYSWSSLGFVIAGSPYARQGGGSGNDFRMSWFAFWNRVLTPAEVLEISKHQFGTPRNPRLIVEPQKMWFVPLLGGTTSAPTTLTPTTLTPPTTLAPTTTAPTTLAPTTAAPNNLFVSKAVIYSVLDSYSLTTPSPTTLPPTTPAPTTKAPTTVAPTTLAPTLPPTTLAPTTLPPTTTAPTTIGPTTITTTASPTTAPPNNLFISKAIIYSVLDSESLTTAPPTTVLPTTKPPTTPTPTTKAPTTVAPTTVGPTTATPTTIGPTTVSPTTLAPTTLPPSTTLAPTTIPPTTPSPTTIAPTTIVPTTTGPTTLAPTTLVPTTAGSTTIGPTTIVTTLAPSTAPTTAAPVHLCSKYLDSPIITELSLLSPITTEIEIGDLCW